MGVLFLVTVYYVSGQSTGAFRDTTGLTSNGLYYAAYVSSAQLTKPVLILVLHGDAPFNNPSYQYAIARRIARENQNTVAIGILRPGYTDEEGNHSQGERGNASGDNYTTYVSMSIQQLVHELITKYNPESVLLVGHSGGAAIAANLISQFSTYAAAVLISCPCDLNRWRKHMKTLQPDIGIWDSKVKSLSAIDNTQRIDDSVQIMMIHGNNDTIVPIEIAHEYADKLSEHGKSVRLITLQDQDHEIALMPEVFTAVKRLIDQIPY